MRRTTARLAPATFAAALAAAAGPACSLFVDLDGIRPVDRDPDGGGSAPALALEVPSFFDDDGIDGAGGGVIFEGVGYRADSLTGEAAEEQAPVPIAIRGLVAGDEVRIAALGFEKLFLCGRFYEEEPIMLDLAELDPPCGIHGSRAAFTLAVPVDPAFDAGEERAIEVRIRHVDGDESVRTLRVLGLPVLDEREVPVPTGRFSEIRLGGFSPPRGGPGIAWEVTSGIRIVGELSVRGEDAKCDPPLVPCLGGDGGAGSGDPGAGAAPDAGCDPQPCPGEEGRGGTAAVCAAETLNSRAPGGGTGGSIGGPGEGGLAGADSSICEEESRRGSPGSQRPGGLAIEDIEAAYGGGGGAGGTLRVPNTEPPLLLSGGPGGGGGGTIAIRSLGAFVLSGQARLDASGGQGIAGTSTASGSGGPGGGGGGGAIRLLADALLVEDAQIAAVATGGRGGLPASSGANGVVRVDAVEAPDLLVDGEAFYGPVFEARLPPITAEAELEAVVLARHAGPGVGNLVLGIRHVTDSEYAAHAFAVTAGQTSVPLPPLAPGLNEICLFVREPSGLVAADLPPAARRCSWVAHMPAD